MYDIQHLCERWGLTTKQVRDRLTVLSPHLTNCVRQGKHGAKLLTDGGLAIFDRLRQLEDGGLAVKAAVEQIQKERAQHEQPPSSSVVSLSSPDGDTPIVTLLQRQVDDLRGERDKLLGLLEQSQAMLPASIQSRQQLGRWDALRVLVTGRV